MRNLIATIVAAVAGIASPAAAQDFCQDVRSLIRAAPSEFAGMLGDPVPNSPPNIVVYLGTETIAGTGVCAVAQQTSNGRRFSTSYTCSGAGPDTNRGVDALAARLAQCLELVAWVEQRQADGRGPWMSQFGLIRLTITRNGAQGLALGVEVFRDERGEVMGSPVRGDMIDANGRHRCTAKSPEEIAGLIAMYGERPGAERFEDQQFIGYRNRLSQPVVAFVTRPSHSAHPAIITRGVFERDGEVYATVQGDFAGDCQAFHELLAQVNAMTQSLREQQR